jgi:hypothetical protein
MDKTDQNNQTLKISFLEISPQINELVKNKEDLNIIFQGYDNFYDFKKHLSKKIPIYLNRYKKALIMTLLKSNNILATGLFTIRPGEQNVIFNYEGKKKVASTKAININNLLDCIKIKILCEFDNNKDKQNSLSSNNILSEPKNNDFGNKYVPKVNLMKQNQKNKINHNNNIGKKSNDKKKNLNNFHINNSTKKNFNNSSQEFSQVKEYSTYLTEEMYNLRQTNTNININNNEIKKLNPYSVSKINNNCFRKTEFDNSAKSKGHINKARSKYNFNTIKKQYSTGLNSKIKMNNSSLNLINNQNNKLISIDKTDNNSNNFNRIKLKSEMSFNKNTKRNFNNKTNNFKNHKNLITCLDNIVSGKIVEHIDMSKSENQYINTTININIKEKNNLISINKNINNNRNNIGLNKNESKKRKLNNNNITINSISTAGTKKNDFEYSINSLLDYEDKINNNKNNFKPFTKRINNERLQQQLSQDTLINRNNNKHNSNKSLYQQSFTDKIFNDGDSNINVNIQNNNISGMCKSFNKLPNELNLKLNSIKGKENNSKGNSNKKREDIDINEFEDEKDEEIDNYERIKEDFNLLYNKEYIHKINEDLLKFELELFIEKMSELFSIYHLVMDSKILENQIIKRDYKKNISQYLLYMKLKNKMEFIKAQLETKKCNLKDHEINLEKQNFENININSNELNILKIILPDNNSEVNKNKILKKILTAILKKQGNNLDEKYKGLLK